jgi:D-alanine-D-alanine ligase
MTTSTMAKSLGQGRRADGRHSGRARDLADVRQRGVLAGCAQGVDAHAFDPAERDLHELKAEGFARCFIALHGRHGEDGTVQGALELLGIPYTGSGVMASAIAMDKVMTKRVWLAEGLPTPRWVRLLAPATRSRERVRTVPDELGLPLIVKPPREGSSIGVTKVQGYSRCRTPWRWPRATTRRAVRGVHRRRRAHLPGARRGRRRARAAGDPHRRARGGNYDYQNKYFTDDTGTSARAACRRPRSRDPAPVLAAYRALGCRGWGRADLMMRAATASPSCWR